MNLNLDSALTYFLLHLGQSVQIRTRQVSAEEVVRTFIGRIHEINGQINAVVDERFVIAIEEAKRCDQIIQSGELDQAGLQAKYPLLGVPFTIKDSFSVEGMEMRIISKYAYNLTYFIFYFSVLII